MTVLRTTRVLLAWLALAIAVQAQQYVFRNFRQADGLKDLTLTDVALDRDGFLWMASNNGAYRFLGSGFQRFGPEQGLTDTDAYDVVTAPTGQVWVGTGFDFYRWDGRHFSPAWKNPIPIDERGPRRIVVEDSSHLLIVTRYHLFRAQFDSEGRFLSCDPVFSKAEVKSLPELALVLNVNLVRDGEVGHTIWIGTAKHLFSLTLPQTAGPSALQTGFADGRVTKWGKKEGLPEERWDSVLLTSEGDLWASGQNHIVVLPRGAAQFVDRSIPGRNTSNAYIQATLLEDSEGRILAPVAGGIARWSGTAWQTVGAPNGLNVRMDISEMIFSSLGDLWIATRGGGLYEWTGYTNWEGWTEEQGLPSDTIWSIHQLKSDRMAIGTERGVAWADLRSGAVHPLTRARWNFGEVGDFAVDSNSVWAATFTGNVVQIDVKSGNAQRIGKVPGTIYSAIRDSRGRVFFGSNLGIYTLQQKSGRTALEPVSTSNALLKNERHIYSICETEDGSDWFLGRKLLRLKDGVWTALDLTSFLKPRSFLVSMSCAPGGVFWVTGQQSGTWRLTLHNGRLEAWQLQLPKALQSLSPLGILDDRRGWIWLGTDAGLLVWNGSSWRHLDEESGLLWTDFDQGALREAADGSIWIGTSGGLSRILHPERAFDPTPLTVSLTQLRLGDEDLLGAEHVTMPWKGPTLHLALSSPTARGRDDLVYRVRFQGLQADWMKISDGLVDFPGLVPGSYTFLAEACDEGLGSCSPPVSLAVTVLAPWWRTYWFIALVLVAAVLLGWAAIRLHARSLKARAHALEQMVRERTQQLEFSREQLRFQATHDELTRMLNRAEILRELAKEMDRAVREGATLVIALCDLDHFKRVNDELGHLAGDEALRCFADAVRMAIRSYDHAGRYGGEEFLFILTGIPPEEAEHRLTGLHRSVSNLSVSWRDSKFTVNCSMGAILFDSAHSAPSTEALLAAADLALYRAKQSGRNRVVLSGTQPASTAAERESLAPPVHR